MTDRRPRARGFTLLEVMVSLAILAVSLVAILNLHSGAVRMHNHAKHLTVATLLARAKMVDIEEVLYAEGLPEFDETEEGTFEEEGWPGFTWTAEIVKPDLGADSLDLVGLLGSALGLDDGAGTNAGGTGTAGTAGAGGAGGLAGLAGMAGMGTDQLAAAAGPMLEQMIPTLEQSVREIRLKVSWQDVTGPSDLSVVTHVVRHPQAVGPGTEEEKRRQDLEKQLQDQRDAANPSDTRTPGNPGFPNMLNPQGRMQSPSGGVRR